MNRREFLKAGKPLALIPLAGLSIQQPLYEEVFWLIVRKPHGGFPEHLMFVDGRLKWKPSTHLKDMPEYKEEMTAEEYAKSYVKYMNSKEMDGAELWTCFPIFKRK
jgi:hypothetical protein